MTITTTTTTLMNCMIAHTRVAALPHVIIVIVISPPSSVLSSLSFDWFLQPHTTVAALPHGPPASRFWFVISGSWFSFLVQKMYDGIYKDWFKRPSFHTQKPIIRNWPRLLLLHMLNCKINSTNRGTFSKSAEKIFSFFFFFRGPQLCPNRPGNTKF